VADGLESTPSGPSLFRRVSGSGPLRTEPAAEFADPDSVLSFCLQLGDARPQPKAVELHAHNPYQLTSPGTVRNRSSEPTMRPSLICVPPYHIAGGSLGAVEPVRLTQDGIICRVFTSEEWVRAYRRLAVNHRDVVPTSSTHRRVLAVLTAAASVSGNLALRRSQMPFALVPQALWCLLPHVRLSSTPMALTETSSDDRGSDP